MSKQRALRVSRVWPMNMAFQTWCISQPSVRTKMGQALMPVTKAQGEAAIQEHFPNAVILRPSIIFGSEDQFFNRFRANGSLASSASNFRGEQQIPTCLRG
jgi:hypothetical protein